MINDNESEAENRSQRYGINRSRRCGINRSQRYGINRSQRYGINRPRPRHEHEFTKCKMCLNIMMAICIKQY